MRGFTLLELLVVIAVITILSTTAFGYYHNFGKNAELETVASMLKSDLRRARGNAMAGDENSKWGIHSVNGSNDYYEIFKTTSDYSNGTVTETVYLPSVVMFEEPSEGMATEALYGKISGETNSSTLTVTSFNRSITITVTASGAVY